MHALITMDPPPISAAAASVSTTDGGIKKSLLSSSDCLHRVDGKDGPIGSISMGNKMNDVTKSHDIGKSTPILNKVQRLKIKFKIQDENQLQPSYRF